MKMLATGPLVLALIFALATHAGGAPLTLPQCVDQAIAHSPRLSAYRHKTAADRYGITKKRGTTLPYVSSKVENYMVNGSPATIWTPLSIGNPGETLLPSARGVKNPNAHWDPVGLQEIGASYPLYENGSILGLNNPPVVAQARAMLTEDQLTAIIEEQKVILEVSDAFVNASSYHNQLQTNEQLVQSYEKELEITKAEVALGIILPQQIPIIGAELEAARQAEEYARYSERNYSTQLAALLGRHGDESVELDNHDLPLPELPSLSQFLSKVMPLHPALMVQDAKIDVARQQLRVDQAANLPTVKLNNEFAVSEDYDYFNGGPFHRRPTEFLSYITIDIPIWDFGQRHAGKLEAAEKVEYEKDLRRADQVTIQSAIAKIYGKAILDAKSIAEHQSKYFSAQQALLLAQAQRQQGSIDELALVSKETAAASEQVALEAATLLERIDYAELQNLSGGVWHWLQ